MNCLVFDWHTFDYLLHLLYDAEIGMVLPGP